jgi:hypothetical protein
MVDSVYEKHILQRTRDRIVLKFGDDKIVESDFVECFKLGGRMNSQILHLVCDLWSEEWPDTIVLKYYSVVSTYIQKRSSWIFVCCYSLPVIVVYYFRVNC